MTLLLNLIVKPILLGIFYAIYLCTIFTGIYFFLKYVFKVDILKSLRK